MTSNQTVRIRPCLKINLTSKTSVKKMITIIYLFISSKSFHGRRAHPLQLWQKVHVFKFLFEHEIRGGGSFRDKAETKL